MGRRPARALDDPDLELHLVPAPGDVVLLRPPPRVEPLEARERVFLDQGPSLLRLERRESPQLRQAGVLARADAIRGARPAMVLPDRPDGRDDSERKDADERQNEAPHQPATNTAPRAEEGAAWHLNGHLAQVELGKDLRVRFPRSLDALPE